MKKLRKMMLATLSLLATAGLAVGVQRLSLTTAQAATIENTSTFKMEKGAAARIKTLTDKDGNEVESNGLRFSAEISQEEYTALKDAGARFGAVIVAKDLAKTVAMTGRYTCKSFAAICIGKPLGGVKLPKDPASRSHIKTRILRRPM